MENRSRGPGGALSPAGPTDALAQNGGSEATLQCVVAFRLVLEFLDFVFELEFLALHLMELQIVG